MSDMHTRRNWKPKLWYRRGIPGLITGLLRAIAGVCLAALAAAGALVVVVLSYVLTAFPILLIVFGAIWAWRHL